MSPSNFVRLAKAEPQLSSTYLRIADWVDEHKSWKWIDPGALAKDIPDVDAFLLTDALYRAVDLGFFTIKYTVQTPTGTLARDSFDSPDQIPRHLPDRFEEYFDTNEYPIVAVLQSVEQGQG